jgi:hypothetical protein
MSNNCQGDGRCFIKCNCFGIYNQPPAHELTRCQCAFSKSNDRENEKYGFRRLSPCPFNCMLKKCRFYNHCNKKAPQWILNTHDKQDINCGMGNTMFDNQTFLQIKAECPVCYDNKYMIQFGCRHTLCFECMWAVYDSQMQANQTHILQDQFDKQSNVVCPLCRDTLSVLK